MDKTKIVIVEDEPDILELVSYNLTREGFETISVTEGDKAIPLIEEQSPSLIILDLMLPGMDGLEICRCLKDSDITRDIPIIMMTAKSEETDVVLGLGLGADDYIPKPFRPKELIARVKAVIRRSSNSNQSQEKDEEVILLGQVQIYPEQYKLVIDGQAVVLTLSEFKILTALAANPNRVLSREQLLRETGGDQVVVIDRNIDVHIRAIRRALKNYAHLIETVRGVGYRLSYNA